MKYFCAAMLMCASSAWSFGGDSFALGDEALHCLSHARAAHHTKTLSASPSSPVLDARDPLDRGIPGRYKPDHNTWAPLREMRKDYERSVISKRICDLHRQRRVSSISKLDFKEELKKLEHERDFWDINSLFYYSTKKSDIEVATTALLNHFEFWPPEAPRYLFGSFFVPRRISHPYICFVELEDPVFMFGSRQHLEQHFEELHSPVGHSSALFWICPSMMDSVNETDAYKAIEAQEHHPFILLENGCLSPAAYERLIECFLTDLPSRRIHKTDLEAYIAQKVAHVLQETHTRICSPLFPDHVNATQKHALNKLTEKVDDLLKKE